MTVVLHLLDTDTASFIIKGCSREIEARLADIPSDRVCISAITRAELMYGLRRQPSEHRLQMGVRAFLKIVPVLVWGAAAADFHVHSRHQLTNSGQPIGNMDMMIAAHALALGAVLVTNNMRHFGRITAPLALVNWQEGAG